MLKEILSNRSCADCRICCVFDKDDCWEMPLITPELEKEIKKDKPDIKVKKTGVCGVFEVEFEEDGLAKCPMLTENGCILGENKPFDCRIWPFRVMKKGDLLLLTLSPVCETVSTLSVSKITDFVKKISDKIFDEANKNTEMIKEYIDGYPVFDIREIKGTK